MPFSHPTILANDFPKLTTERLELCPLKDSDIDEIFELHTDTEVMKHIDRSPLKSRVEALGFIRKINGGIAAGEWMYWKIQAKDDASLIGTICLWLFSEDGKSADIGYELRKQFWGHGYMQEAIKAVVPYGFETLEFEKISAYTHQENEASIKLAVKMGFEFEFAEKENVNYILLNK